MTNFERLKRINNFSKAWIGLSILTIILLIVWGTSVTGASMRVLVLAQAARQVTSEQVLIDLVEVVFWVLNVALYLGVLFTTLLLLGGAVATGTFADAGKEGAPSVHGWSRFSRPVLFFLCLQLTWELLLFSGATLWVLSSLLLNYTSNSIIGLYQHAYHQTYGVLQEAGEQAQSFADQAYVQMEVGIDEGYPSADSLMWMYAALLRAGELFLFVVGKGLGLLLSWQPDIFVLKGELGGASCQQEGCLDLSHLGMLHADMCVCPPANVLLTTTGLGHVWKAVATSFVCMGGVILCTVCQLAILASYVAFNKGREHERRLALGGLPRQPNRT